MRTTDGTAARPLFRARSEDGIHWMLVILADGGWMITRNGREVESGTSERASIALGVKKFSSLTRVVVSSDVACNPAVGALLDRIEDVASARKTAKSQGRVRPRAPKGQSARLTVSGIAVS